MSEWQPIETAPGEICVLITFTKDDRGSVGTTNTGVMIAYLDEYYAPGGDGHDGSGNGWVDASSGEQPYLQYGHPTHWMPLPEPPSE